jgi:nucleotide-binding universal stress UspA family protein
MDTNKRMLVAVDGSEASHRAVGYVAAMIGGRRGFHIRLLHVLPPFPPELLEFGGSENPEVEAQKEAELRKEQAEWLDRAKQADQPMLEQAVSILRQARIPARAVDTQFATSISGQDLITNILEAAKADNCATIVVGRELFTGLQRVFEHHVADELIRRGHGYTIWVVE